MQVVSEGAGQKFLDMRRKDQQKALDIIRTDPGLGELDVIEGPLLGLEVRGVPALMYFGSVVWK